MTLTEHEGWGIFRVKIGTPKELFEGEARVAMTPDSATQLQKLGHECVVESGAGALAGFDDASYKAAGVEVVKTAAALWKAADVVAKVRAPNDAEVKRLRDGQTVISFINPAANEKLLEQAAKKGSTVVAMDMVPRISRAQKMDALSSMANIAGYRAVIEAGNNFGRFFTGQITAAGKVPPAKGSGCGRRRGGLGGHRHVNVAWGRSPTPLMCGPKWRNRVESMGAEFVFLDFEEEQAGRRGDRRLCGCVLPRVPRGTACQVPRTGTGQSTSLSPRRLIPNREAPELVDRRYGRRR